MTDEQLYIELCAFISENKRALFDRIAPERMRHVTVVLEDIYQSHNASAVVRTCDTGKATECNEALAFFVG